MRIGAIATPKKMFDAALMDSQGVVPTVQLNIQPNLTVSHWTEMEIGENLNNFKTSFDIFLNQGVSDFLNDTP